MALLATTDVGVTQFARISCHALEQTAGDHEASPDTAGSAVDVDQMIGLAVIAEQVLGNRPGVGVVGRKHR